MTFKVMAAALAACAAMAVSAQAATVATLADLNLRSGPGKTYEPIARLPRGTRLDLGECTADLNWCRVSADGTEGWASSHYLSEPGGSESEARAPRVVEERTIVEERFVEEVPEAPVRRRPAYQDYPDEGDVLIGPADGDYADDYEARPRVYLRIGAGGVSYGPRGYHRRYQGLHLGD